MARKAPYEIIPCDCEYYEPPCRYCCTDAVVAVYQGGRAQYMKKSEAIEQERNAGRQS
jgi:hypothetical protein